MRVSQTRSVPVWHAGLYVADRMLCDQVDGPHHWLANSRAATGETLGRRRLLAARGWAVVSVPYFAWPAGALGEKQAYMHAVRCTAVPGAVHRS